MISISNNSRVLVFLVCSALFAAGAVPLSARAQQSVALSVTPTFFEMSANPGQLWQSSVKVVNSNNFEMTVYAQPVNFAPQGESGQGKFLPVFEEVTEGSTLAEWIDISSDPIVIPPQESKTISFIVEVPDGASPGGHFAAILVSTQPPETSDRLQIRTTQIVSSLFFVRVAGDVNEHGSIRSFTTESSFSQTPHADFSLRFENKGNVHLQPRGDITIYNMWGQERGTIPINHKTHFGNVLPDSIRNFEFSWSGERSFSEFGRYKAIAALAYGQNARQFATSSTYFWVIPLKPMLITLGLVIGFVLFISWAIKLYVRRMLQLAGVPLEQQSARPVIKHKEVEQKDPEPAVTIDKRDITVSAYKTISAPVRSGYLDLRSRLEDAKAIIEVVRVFVSFVGAYKVFFVTALVLLLAFFGLYYFILDATDTERSYEVSIENPGVSLELSSEEIKYEELIATENLPSIGDAMGQSYDIVITNTSTVAGVGAQSALHLIRNGYRITAVDASSERIDKSSIVIFDPELQTEAVEISKLLGGALLSARTSSSTSERPNITVFTGKDRVLE